MQCYIRVSLELLGKSDSFQRWNKFAYHDLKLLRGVTRAFMKRIKNTSNSSASKMFPKIITDPVNWALMTEDSSGRQSKPAGKSVKNTTGSPSTPKKVYSEPVIWSLCSTSDEEEEGVPAATRAPLTPGTCECDK